jgi:energy-coupling factor transporter ATP-binding protein EcfA2
MSMVLQETILFSGSVVENIAYGRADATWAEIITAAKQANAVEFIERMPEGYYTLLGERGANLSGGQRQRLAIARAFIRNSPILILDEPSTGLDAESTDLVLRALRQLMKGKTTVIISHELNLIRNADKIVVIKNGEIEQVGSHESLLESGGLYATLYMKQYGQAAANSPQGPEGVPLPAPEAGPAELRAEDSAWGASAEDVYLDLPNSPPMLGKLPALAQAFDAEKMRDLLQTTLFSESDPAYRIEACKPGKALYLPENICNMQYELKVKEVETGQTSKYVINARLFPSLQACENYRSEFLAPLAAQMRGRPEIASFAHPVAVLEDLNMALSVFPIDGLLPPLIGASSRERMIEIFKDTVPEVLSGSLEIEDLRIEFAHYGRFRHCVLRYIIEGKLSEGGTPHQQIIYGKVDADNYGALTIPVMSALLERTGSNPDAFRFRVPRPLGFLPDLKLLLIENLPGNARMKDLLLDRLCGTPGMRGGSATLDGAIESCAHILAALHSSKIKLGRRRTFNDEVGALKEELQLMLQVFPSLGGQIESWMDEVVAFAEPTPPMGLCFNHGDFTYSQLIFQENDVGLLDFDSVCQAEPALDLGQFLAYQRMVICKEQNPDAPMEAEEVERLSELFLSTYISLSGDWVEDVEQLRNRVTAYEIVSLIRLAVHSWGKLKGARLYHTVNILKERMTCLARVSG